MGIMCIAQVYSHCTHMHTHAQSVHHERNENATNTDGLSVTSKITENYTGPGSTRHGTHV